MNVLLLASLVGCAPGPIDAPFGAELVIPEDINFSMDAGLVEPGDGYGHLIFGDFYVIGPNSLDEDAPMNDIKVEFLSGWTGAYLIPEEAVTIVTSYEEACATASEEDACHIYFDDENDFWVEFAGDYEDIGDFRPTYYSGATDNNGRIRVYLFIDSVPLNGDGEPAPISYYASITGTTEIVTVTPLSSASEE